jgi:hypothetical protein
MIRTLLAGAALLAVVPNVRAQLIAYDGFAYSPSQSLNGQNGGSGFSGAWQLATGTITVQSGSLTPATPSNSLIESGNSLILTPTSATTIAHATRSFASAILGTNGTSIWISVVMKGTGEIGTTAEGRLMLSNGSSGFSIETGQGVQGAPPPNNQGPNADWSVQGPPPQVEGTSSVSNTLQSLLVVKYTFGSASDFINLYVNPPLTGVPPSSPSATTTGNHVAFFTTLDLSYGSSNGASNSVLLDEVRVGNTFGDVTPVPEPSTLTMVGAAACGLLAPQMRRGSTIARHRRLRT